MKGRRRANSSGGVASGDASRRGGAEGGRRSGGGTWSIGAQLIQLARQMINSNGGDVKW